MNKKLTTKSAFLRVVILCLIATIALYGCASDSDSGEEQSAETVNTEQVEKTSEPLTEEAVEQRATEYWEAAKFRDYGAAYDFLGSELRSQISREEYIKRQEWLDEETLAGVTQIEEIVISGVTLNDNSATVRITLKTSSGDFSDSEEYIYEDGKWFKKFTNYDAISVGKSFEEFVAANN